MTQNTSGGVAPATFVPITNRDLSNLAADKAAVAAMLQAAVNVENFTIPLYLCSMSSVFGTHAISGNPLVAGRLWPGQSTTAMRGCIEQTPNQIAYNTVFSVFIQEMLHLQLAANLATMFGVAPKFFDGTLLQNNEKGWGCYGPTNSVIPHIIDLKDTTTFSGVAVNLDALNQTQLNLFLAIEQSHEAARDDIKPGALGKYFPNVPFTGWNATDGEADLPLFGTIGWMYYCLLSYLLIEYTDKQTLLDKMYTPENYSKQRDIFNRISSNGHPQAEYPKMPTKFSPPGTAASPVVQALDIVEGICDQGEGNSEGLISLLRRYVQPAAATGNNVPLVFQPDKAALVADYGEADADARSTGDAIDHWERFNELRGVLGRPGFLTFDEWFKQGNAWEGKDLYSGPAPAPSALPSPDQVAAALNGLRATEPEQPLLKHLVVGAINGINTALTTCWSGPQASFPFPAMQASGDRMTLYWAVMGAAPDLSQPLPPPSGDDAHACQGLSTTHPGNDCAALAVFHTCSGSNSCKGQGGCGYPNQITPAKDSYFFAPSNNSCSSEGGCGAPISAWQELGSSGTMEVMDFSTRPPSPLQRGGGPVTFPFAEGASAYAAAWQAYLDVQNLPPTTPVPAPNNLRMVIPPN